MGRHGGGGGHHAAHHTAAHHAAIHHTAIHTGGIHHVGTHFSNTNHHHTSRSSGTSVSLASLWKSPAQILFESHMREIEARISPPFCPYSFLLNFAFFLSFVTLPLTAAMIGTPWLIVDTGVKSFANSTWDGRTSNCVAQYGGRRVSGFLSLWKWEDCNDSYNTCGESVTWSYCGDSYYSSPDGSGSQDIQTSSLAESSKNTIAFSAALSIITLFSIALLLVRNCRASGSRLSMQNRHDPFYIKFVRTTRLQLVLHIILVAAALGSFFDTIPNHFRSYFSEKNLFIGTSFKTRLYFSEETISAPGQALGISICVLSGISFFLHTLYSFNIESWAASHPIGELEPEPPQPTESERAAAVTTAVSQAHALKAAELMLMLQALQKGGPNGVIDSAAIQSVVAQLAASEAAFASAYAQPSTTTINEGVGIVTEGPSTTPSIPTTLDFSQAFDRLSPEAKVYLVAEAQRLGTELPSTQAMMNAPVGAMAPMTSMAPMAPTSSQSVYPSYPVSSFPTYSIQPQIYPSPVEMTQTGIPIQSEMQPVSAQQQPLPISTQQSQTHPQLNTTGISGHAVFDASLGYHVFVPNRH